MKFLPPLFYVLLMGGVSGCISSSQPEAEIVRQVLSSEEMFSLIKTHLPEDFHPVALKKIAIENEDEAIRLYSDGKRFFLQDYEKCFPLNPQLGILKIKRSFGLKLGASEKIPGYFVVAENELYRHVILIFAKFSEQWHCFYVTSVHGDVNIHFLNDFEKIYITASEGNREERGFLVVEPENVMNPLSLNWLGQKKCQTTEVHMPMYDVQKLRIYRGFIEQKKKENLLENLIPHLLSGKFYCEINHLNRMSSHRVFLLYPQSLRSINYDISQAYTFVGWSHPVHSPGEKEYDIENYFYRVEREKKEPLKAFFPSGVDFFYLFDFQ